MNVKNDGKMLLRDDPLAKWMLSNGIPVSRESYMHMNWGNKLPEWTPELEAELPEELQRWDLFQLVEGRYVYREPEQ